MHRRFRFLHRFLRLAMSAEDAKKILGFEPTESPSPDEISKAYKKRAFEAHPDRGGDPKKMVELNVAKDILDEKQHPDRPITGPSRSPQQTAKPYEPPKMEKTEVTWEEAMLKAHVPTSGVIWKFRTESRYDGYGDRHLSGFVVYGKSDAQHVFVAVEYYHDADYFEGWEKEEHWMEVKKHPLTKPLRDLAPRAIREMFADFPRLKKSYNARVEIYKDNITHFASDVIERTGLLSREAIPFKDAMAKIGEISSEDPWVKDRKITIEIRCIGRHANPKYKGYEPGAPYEPTDIQEFALNVAGTSMPFNEKTNYALNHIKQYDLLKKIFGDYIYAGSSRKVITRMRNPKEILTALLKLCEHDSAEIRDVLQRGIDQTK